MIFAGAIPPAAHIVTSPSCPPERASSYGAVLMSIEPVAPFGSPSAIAPPLIFTLLRSRSRSRRRIASADWARLTVLQAALGFGKSAALVDALDPQQGSQLRSEKETAAAAFDLIESHEAPLALFLDDSAILAPLIHAVARKRSSDPQFQHWLEMLLQLCPPLQGRPQGIPLDPLTPKKIAVLKQLELGH